MKPETKRTIFFVILFGGLAAAGWIAYNQLVNKKPALSKSDKVVAILSMSGGEGDYNFLMGLGDSYIDAWYSAVIAKNSNFMVGSQTFDTVTGKQIS